MCLRWVSLSLVVLLAGCPAEEGVDSDLPESCDNGTARPECKQDFAARCEGYSQSQCEQASVGPGNEELRCEWVDSVVRITVGDDGTCQEDALAPRCVGVSWPGEVACGAAVFEDDDDGVVALLGTACYPIDTVDCDDPSQAPAFPAECACLEPT